MSNRNPIKITIRCPRTPCGGRVRTQIDRIGRIDAQCPRCREPIALTASPDCLESDGHESRKIKKCVACPGREFFIRKDFPQKIGLTLVVLFGVVATVFFARKDIVATFATLLALVIVDAIIFLLVGKVTVCYRCRAEYRGVVYNPDHSGFDLATSEKYS